MNGGTEKKEEEVEVEMSGGLKTSVHATKRSTTMQQWQQQEEEEKKEQK